MQDAVKLNPVRAIGAMNLPRLQFDLRQIAPVALYIIAYAAINWGVEQTGLAQLLGRFSMVAGLNLALVLLYGFWYSPIVILVTLVDGLWYRPLHYSLPFAVMFCLAISLIEISGALGLRYLGSEQRFALKRNRDILQFAACGALVSALLATATCMPLLFGDSLTWPSVSSKMQLSMVAFGAGILFASPLLVIHTGPWLETLLFGIKMENQSPAEYLLPDREKTRGRTLSLSFALLAFLVLYLIFIVGITDRMYVFLLLSVPLIWVAARRGLEGLSIAVPGFLGVSLATMAYLHKAADSGEFFLAILIASSLNAYMVAVGVTQTRLAAWQMKRRDAILDAVGYAAERFLGDSGWETGVHDVIRRLGEATSVTHVFLVDKRTPNLSEQSVDSYWHEWAASSPPAEKTDKRVLNLLRGQMIEELSAKLSMGQPCVFRTKDIDRQRREMLETLGIRSGVLIPMFIDRQWWGCLGLEQCYVDRDWTDSEVDGLSVAGQLLGTLIASVRIEQQFRQLTGNIQAVFWISDPDGRTKQYVSPGYEEIWGRTCVSLRQAPRSWLQGIHQEDQERVCEALVKQGWGDYSEEYRVVRPDGSIRWVHDRAFPVRDQSGQVCRIVGIAADISREKETEEQLRAATVMLSSMINHLQSGIMVEDESRQITHVNQAFNQIFNVPVPPQSLFGVDSRLLFIQTGQFAERIEQVIEGAAPIIGEEVECQGRIFLRNYVPLSINETSRYHLWQYRDITESRMAEAQIKSSLKEKEVLLQEIHHRVKNNLQIISSLLNLQSTEIEDLEARQKFRESQDRVKAMALIHERLYQSGDLAKIDFSGYVRSLTGHLLRSYQVNANSIRLSLKVDPVPMNLDVAIPCGLMINELVSNAFKYAFPTPAGGEILVRFSEENGGKLGLVVSDNGIGFPEDKNPEESDSLGLKLVRTLTEQLGGQLQYRNQNGFQCEISIPPLRT
jgi:PAS domain S-box-containing protein